MRRKKKREIITKNSTKPLPHQAQNTHNASKQKAKQTEKQNDIDLTKRSEPM
jgi:hypothetical protein